MRRFRRLKSADFDIGVFVHRGQHRVQARRAVVVQQQPHAHAPVGSGVQRFQQHRARHVVVPDVVLQVQAASCVRGDHRAGRERIHAIAEERDAGLAGMGLLQWHDLLVDARLRRLQWQHVRGRALCLRREMVGQQQAGQHQQQQGGDDDRSDTQQALPQGLGRTHAPMWLHDLRGWLLQAMSCHAWMGSEPLVTAQVAPLARRQRPECHAPDTQTTHGCDLQPGGGHRHAQALGGQPLAGKAQALFALPADLGTAGFVLQPRQQPRTALGAAFGHFDEVLLLGAAQVALQMGEGGRVLADHHQAAVGRRQRCRQLQPMEMTLQWTDAAGIKLA
ncbi:hypothetical protein G6F23_012706 [Rhizopus arrhizus]|nr:hypothetical protein G6F23_012706 [Rhizopus arrhizus]